MDLDGGVVLYLLWSELCSHYLKSDSFDNWIFGDDADF